MTGRAVKILNYSKGLDASQPLIFFEDIFKKHFKRNKQITWVARYGPKSASNPIQKPVNRASYSSKVNRTLSKIEARLILYTLGLKILPVQYHLSSGATAALGTKYGSAFAAWAKNMGIPAGVHLWCDLESQGNKSTTSDCIKYANAWSKEVVKAKYRAGLYLSLSLPSGFLSSNTSINKLTDFTCFWRPDFGSHVRIQAPTCGFSIKQYRQEFIAVKCSTKNPIKKCKCKYINCRMMNKNRRMIQKHFAYDMDVIEKMGTPTAHCTPPYLWSR